MKKEYDFSHAQRGKFVRKNATLNIPVYLNSETYPFVERLAVNRNTDLSSVVNDLLRATFSLPQS